MPRFEQRDKDGKITDVFIVSEETLKEDPEALIRQVGPKGSRAAAPPEGYELIASADNDPDALLSDVAVHYFAKRGSYEKEKPSKLSGLKAVVAEAEAKKEEQPVIK